MTTVAIIGDGGWGTALALVLARNGHAVRVWGPFPEYIEQIKKLGENVKFLPGVRLPADIVKTAQNNKVIRDGVASFFFHPYYPLAQLQAIVTGVKAAGYTFVAASAL